MTRGCAAIALVLLFSGAPALPIFGTTFDGCARCPGAARCCCASAKGAGSCRLDRPCSTPDDGAQTPQDTAKAVVESSVTGRGPQASPASPSAEPPAGPVDLPSVPPDPPPRPSL